jgi:hypothetical protein
MSQRFIFKILMILFHLEATDMTREEIFKLENFNFATISASGYLFCVKKCVYWAVQLSVRKLRSLSTEPKGRVSALKSLHCIRRSMASTEKQRQ